MSVLLIQPSYALNEYQRVAFEKILLPSLGLGYLAGVLQEAGIPVVIIDLNIQTQEDLRRILLSGEIKIVGLTSYTYNFSNFIKTAKFCRQQKPDIKLIGGGIHVTYDYKKLLIDNILDYVVRFEGEYSFAQLCQKLLNNDTSISAINNLVYSNGFDITRTRPAPYIDDLDRLPCPVLHMEKYINQSVPILTGRGCAYGCVYCSAGAYWGAKMRYRSVNNIMAEICKYRAAGHVNFTFVDDNFNLDKARFVSLCTELKRHRLLWNASCSMNSLSVDILRMMRDCGCYDLSIGIESVDPAVQKSIGKVIDIPAAEKLIQYALSIGIGITAGFIFFHHGDTRESITQTKAFAERLRQLGVIPRFTVNTPFRGTYQYDHREELGITIREENTDKYDLRYPVCDTKNFKQSEIEQIFNSEIDYFNEDKYQALMIKYNIKNISDLTPDMVKKILGNNNSF